MQKRYLKRGVLVVFTMLFISLFLVHLTSAFGISTPYLEGETLKVSAGENYVYPITIQNSDTQDYYVDITYNSTKNVTTLNNQTYFIPSNTYNSTINFNIVIPKQAIDGETYILEYIARPKTKDGTATGIEIRRGITILVTSKTENS